MPILGDFDSGVGAAAKVPVLGDFVLGDFWAIGFWAIVLLGDLSCLAMTANRLQAVDPASTRGVTADQIPSNRPVESPCRLTSWIPMRSIMPRNRLLIGWALSFW